MPDYGSWHFTRRELLLNCAVYAGLDLLIAMLFYRSLLAALLFSPGLPLFLKMRKKDLLEQRRLEILRQFTTGMQLVNASLQAGYAIENAWKEALNELRKIYEPDSFIVTEFRYIILQTSLNVPIEGLLLDLGRRSHVDDVRNFAEVFQTAKRTGGDLMSIIRNTVSAIQSKNETRQEIGKNIGAADHERRSPRPDRLYHRHLPRLSGPLLPQSGRYFHHDCKPDRLCDCLLHRKADYAH